MVDSQKSSISSSRKYPKVNCPQCGREVFLVYPDDPFCSKKCKREYRKNHVPTKLEKGSLKEKIKQKRQLEQTSVPAEGLMEPHTDIIKRIDEVLNSYSEYKKLRRTEEEQEKVRTILSSLVSTLDGVWKTSKMAAWNHRLLTLIYKRKSRQNMKAISEELEHLLFKLIGDPSKIDEIDRRTLDKIIAKSSRIVQKVQKIDRAICGEIDSVRDSMLQRVQITEQILRIPDIAESVKDTEALHRCIKDIKTFLEDSKTEGDMSELEKREKEWDNLTKEYQNYRDIDSYEDLKQKYDFSDSTIGIIKDLLEGKELSLYSIKPQVLKELYTFDDFCKATTLKFKTGREEDAY